MERLPTSGTCGPLRLSMTCLFAISAGQRVVVGQIWEQEVAGSNPAAPTDQCSSLYYASEPLSEGFVETAPRSVGMAQRLS